MNPGDPDGHGKAGERERAADAPPTDASEELFQALTTTAAHTCLPRDGGQCRLALAGRRAGLAWLPGVYMSEPLHSDFKPFAILILVPLFCQYSGSDAPIGPRG